MTMVPAAAKILTLICCLPKTIIPIITTKTEIRTDMPTFWTFDILVTGSTDCSLSSVIKTLSFKEINIPCFNECRPWYQKTIVCQNYNSVIDNYYHSSRILHLFWFTVLADFKITNFLFRITRDNVLWAVPVPGFYMNNKCTFDLPFVVSYRK